MPAPIIDVKAMSASSSAPFDFESPPCSPFVAPGTHQRSFSHAQPMSPLSTAPAISATQRYETTEAKRSLLRRTMQLAIRRSASDLSSSPQSSYAQPLVKVATPTHAAHHSMSLGPKIGQTDTGRARSNTTSVVDVHSSSQPWTMAAAMAATQHRSRAPSVSSLPRPAIRFETPSIPVADNNHKLSDLRGHGRARGKMAKLRHREIEEASIVIGSLSSAEATGARRGSSEPSASKSMSSSRLASVFSSIKGRLRSSTTILPHSGHPPTLPSVYEVDRKISMPTDDTPFAASEHYAIGVDHTAGGPAGAVDGDEMPAYTFSPITYPFASHLRSYMGPHWCPAGLGENQWEDIVQSTVSSPHVATALSTYQWPETGPPGLPSSSTSSSSRSNSAPGLSRLEWNGHSYTNSMGSDVANPRLATSPAAFFPSSAPTKGLSPRRPTCKKAEISTAPKDEDRASKRLPVVAEGEVAKPAPLPPLNCRKERETNLPSSLGPSMWLVKHGPHERSSNRVVHAFAAPQPLTLSQSPTRMDDTPRTPPCRDDIEPVFPSTPRDATRDSILSLYASSNWSCASFHPDAEFTLFHSQHQIWDTGEFGTPGKQPLNPRRRKQSFGTA
ncbi:hypothetical protein ACQY0O_007325 [Thecaphora frezii]